jgi:hypothetical protein
VGSAIALSLVVLVVAATIRALRAPSPWLGSWGWLYWTLAAILIAVWLSLMLGHLQAIDRALR